MQWLFPSHDLEEGIDKFLGKVPEGKKSIVKEKLEALLEFSRASGALTRDPIREGLSQDVNQPLQELDDL